MTRRRAFARLALPLALLGLASGCGITAPDEPDRVLPSAVAPTVASPSVVVGSTPSFVRPTVAPAALLALFAYDARAPLNVRRLQPRQKGDILTTDVYYDVAGGPQVQATMVRLYDLPAGRHPLVPLARG